MRINTNITALITNNHLHRTERRAALSMAKLSSGSKINSVKDDASGMAIGNKMTNLIKGLEIANRNSMDGISIVQTADGALSEVHSMLQRVRELAVQASNDTNEPEDRAKMQIEVDQLVKEIDATADRTEFNNIKLLNGGMSAPGQDGVNGGESNIGAFRLQVGANKGMEMIISIPDLSAKALGLNKVSLNTQDDAGKAISILDSAIETVSKARAKLGSYQNRLESVILGIDSQSAGTEAARSRIMDTDMAREMTAYTQANIIMQAGISILAQANQRPQQLIQLLG